MHPDLRRALERLARTTEPVGPVIRSYRGFHLKANSVVNWFIALSSATKAARRIPDGAASSNALGIELERSLCGFAGSGRFRRHRAPPAQPDHARRRST